MDTAHFVQELARQNQLLKETISNFPSLLEGEEGYQQGDYAGQYFETDADSSVCSTASRASHASCHSASSNTTTMRIETLIDLLDRQESRLDLLERFGQSILLESPIPILRGLKPTAYAENQRHKQISVRDWCSLVLNRLRCLKSLNSHLQAKDLIKFIHSHLDDEPLKLMNTLLQRNRMLVRSHYPQEIPRSCLNDLDESDAENQHLYDYPFKLHVLRYPGALLNMIQSKFDHTKPANLESLNRITLQPGDSLLSKHPSSSSSRSLRFTPRP